MAGMVGGVDGLRRRGQGGFLAAAQDVGGVVLVGVAERFVGGQGQVAGAGVAVFGLFGHAAGDHRVKGFRMLGRMALGLGMGYQVGS